ncbi:hypothetical protein V6N12_003696 [Hibiscus sabdariffa]|uniref:F-box domain-containing protein n=1 Tax=Hibiscus sabdariffa TaxID=183260 RepID=A0ABR1ZTK1_9ROSI
MSDYIPVEVIVEILKRLPVKSLVKCKSVCKLEQCDLRPMFHFYSFTSFTFQQHSLSPPRALEKGFLLWNPSIQKYISLPQFSVSESMYLNVGFGFDSRTKDYKLLIVGEHKHGSCIESYLFSFNENCWRRVTAGYPNYAFLSEMSMPFVNGAVHWLGHWEINNGKESNGILGFELSAEEFFQVSFPKSLILSRPFDLSIVKYGESSIAVSTHPPDAELHELWIMKEVLGFWKNGEVLLHMHNAKMASLDLNSQQMKASLDLNSQQVELHVVDVGTDLLSVRSYVESLVLLDKVGNVYSESDVNHPIDSSDSE